MTTTAGVGRSLNHDAVTAGREVVERALAELKGEGPSFALLFATAGYDQDALVASVSDALGEMPLSGCSGEGVISAAGSDECSHAAVLMLIASDELTFETFNVAGFADDATRAAEELAEQLAGRTAPGSLLLLFPEGVRGNCKELIEALEAKLDPLPLIAGGTAGDMLRFEATYQYHDGQALTDTLSAVLIGGAFEAEVVVSHGCDMIGQQHTVTRAEGGFVYEIDERPAWSLFKSYLDDDADSLEAMHIAHLLLAERVDERDGGGAYGEFLVRVPVSLDEEQGALYFAAGLSSGTRVQLALRNAERVTQHAVSVSKALVARRARPPMLVLQLDCAGRGRLLFDEDASACMVQPVREVIGQDVPWVGLHTYGEIAPVGKRTYFHNYTSVICALYPTADA